MIYPYVQSTQVYACPSNQYTGVDPTIVGIPALPRDNAINSHFAVTPTANAYGVIPLMSSLIMPSSAIYLAENCSTDSRTMYSNWTSTEMVNYAYYTGTVVNFHGHTGMFNVLFADGHAKAMPPTATETPVNMWAYMNDSPGSCNTGSISQLNCQTVSNNALNVLGNLQTAYQ